ncbi:MAG TPA: glycosyltransferase [Candidatus Competibacteraceae bacterium]|nr:glycosyltransferase [Candidatus Competibacteraceae bacterium]
MSIVTYRPDLPLLQRVLQRLAAAATEARAAGRLGRIELVLVDNGPDGSTAQLQRLLQADWCEALDSARLLSGHGNVGYGAGHNLGQGGSQAAWRLILNPDVLLERDALSAALGFLYTHPEVGLLAPRVEDGQGRLQYLCKRYPSALLLLLRGFAPPWLQRLWRQRLAAYELRDRIDGATVVLDVPIVSGCCMLFRDALWQRLGGFARDYFLYFEDFDLSLRAGRVARIAYVPQVRAVHFGGHAARKGLRHILLFFRSMLTFFNRHGWRWC